jgi:hypothetical protein
MKVALFLSLSALLLTPAHATLPSTAPISACRKDLNDRAISAEHLRSRGRLLAITEHPFVQENHVKLELYRLDGALYAVIEMSDEWRSDHFKFGANSERVLPQKHFVVPNVTRKIIRETRARGQLGRACGVLMNNEFNFWVVYGIEHHQHFLETQSVFSVEHPTHGDVRGYFSFSEISEQVLAKRIERFPDQRGGDPITDYTELLRLAGFKEGHR